MPTERLELSRPLGHCPLKTACLPVPPHRQMIYQVYPGPVGSSTLLWGEKYGARDTPGGGDCFLVHPAVSQSEQGVEFFHHRLPVHREKFRVGFLSGDFFEPVEQVFFHAFQQIHPGQQKIG